MGEQKKEDTKEHISGTGSHEEVANFKTITYRFDKYEIIVKLTEDNKFIEIIEVKINKDFLEHKQKALPQGYHAVEEYYPE